MSVGDFVEKLAKLEQFFDGFVIRAIVDDVAMLVNCDELIIHLNLSHAIVKW